MQLVTVVVTVVKNVKSTNKQELERLYELHKNSPYTLKFKNYIKTK